MRIGKINNSPAFGYDRYLNKTLKDRLKQDTEDNGRMRPMSRAINKLNDSCNSLENTIVSLEKKGLEDNELQVANICNAFIGMKLSLCKMVERYFPDLNYINTEMDGYVIDNMEKANFDDQLFERSIAYTWRAELAEAMDEIFDEELEVTKITTGKLDSESGENKVKSQSSSSSSSSNNSSKFIKFTPNTETPKGLDDVVGLGEIRDDIEDLIIYPLEHPDEAEKMKKDYGINVPYFIVFHGPPGCGKTMLAQAIAAQTGNEMYQLSLSSIGSSYINETSNNIRAAFENLKEVAKGSEKPVILFMDEMDSVLTHRKDSNQGENEDNKVVNTLLELIPTVKGQNIIVIGATNFYKSIDEALKRRVDLQRYVGLPNSEEIQKLLRKQLEQVSMAADFLSNEEAMREISKELRGYSPSNITNIIQKAGLIAFRKKSSITAEDFRKAIKVCDYKKINEKEYRTTETKIGFNKE